MQPALNSTDIDYDNYHSSKIKSLDEFTSDEDDDDDSKSHYFDTLTISETSETGKEHQIAHVNDENINQDLAEETNNNTDTSDNEKEPEQEEEEEEEDETEDDEDDDSVYLIQDIELKQLLKKKGYRGTSKLVTTDQGSVWRAKTSKKNGNKNVVIKIASKAFYDDDEKEKGDKNIESEHENILKEIEILRRLNGEQENASNEDVRNSIIRVIDTIDDDKTNNYMVILEDGGKDLFNFTKNCHQEIAMGKITIKEWKKTVKLIAKKLINLIDWLHTEISLCHLDISLENVLISNISWINYPDHNENWKKKLSPDFQLKLIDFGACQLFDGKKAFQCKSVIGKPSYCSPQIFSLQNKSSTKPYDARNADVWSFGVSLFIMMIGCPPWEAPDELNDARFQAVVIQKNLDYLLTAWKRSHFMDDKMKDILNKIFVMDEKERISTKEIIKHSWLC